MTKYKETEIGRVPSDWEVSTLGEICVLLTDGAHTSPKAVSSKFKMASVKDMRYNYFDFSDCKTISEEDYNYLVKNKCQPEKGDILLSKDGANCLDIIFVYNQDDKIVLLSSIAIARLKIKFDPHFYRYFLLTRNAQHIMRSRFISGSAIPRVILKDFKNVPIPILNYKKQKEISKILQTLDLKISLLHQQNQTLEELAQTLFKRWFVDFEFPAHLSGNLKSEQGYKSSGGKMIDSEMGEIPEGWETSTIGDITINHDKLRKPLSKNQRLKRQGIYPYHGATSIMDFVDDYIFDGKYLLLGEDGSVVDENGYPYLQYVKGKFWVNNHAHVLEGKGSITTDYLYLLLSKTNISNIVTGAVQLKINQGNLNSIEVVLPSKKILKSFNSLISPLFSKVFNLKTEIQTLTKLRDNLLPKLMSGDLKIN